MSEVNEALRRVFDKISTRLNNTLCEMKPDYDDSIVGFNEAWDIMRAVFNGELAKEMPGTPAQAVPADLSAAASYALEWFESENFVPVGYSRSEANIGPVTQKVFDDLRAALAAPPQAAPADRKTAILECIDIVRKYDDAGASFVEDELRELAAQSSPALSHVSQASGAIQPSDLDRGAGEAIFAECAEIALELVGATKMPSYDEACRDIAKAIRMAAERTK